MNSSNRILFETDEYRLYSIFESVYLKEKIGLSSGDDLFISSIYGDPDSGLISFNNEFVVIAGCGITVYFIADKSCYEIGTEPENILWTEGVYQSGEDSYNFVRFIAYIGDNLIRVHRLDVFTKKIEVL